MMINGVMEKTEKTIYEEAFDECFDENTREETLNVYDYYSGLVDGINWHKEHMMKDAIG